MATKTAPKTDATTPVSFLAQLVQLAKATDKKSVSAKSTPVENMRLKFEQHANEQITQLKTGATKGRWFGQNPVDKSFTIALRNGNKVLSIDKTQYFQTPDAEAAIKFLSKAIEAVKSGELDMALEATMRKKASAEA